MKPYPATHPAPYPEPFASDVIAGLAQPLKRIPFQYFYDDAGARLFTRITVQPEYYVTRTETAILRQHAGAIADAVGPGVGLCELGSGSGDKTRVVLDHLHDPAWYVPVDIAAEQLQQTAAALNARYPDLPVRPLQADFTQPFALPRGLPPARRRVLFSPGLTLWNLPLDQRRELLERLRDVAEPHGGLLLGVDWVKAPDMLEAAYDDSAGVTARFNLNVLTRINRELDGTFKPADFRHRARWCPETSRVEVALVAQRAVTVHVAGTRVTFAAGESIVTEYSYKFTPERFVAAMDALGWRMAHRWSDDDERMSVVLLVPSGETPPA